VAFLKEVSITFDTHDDSKNDTTIVNVFVKNRMNNSLTPEQNDFISNWLTLQRYSVGTGDINDNDRNPYLAVGYFLGYNDEFDDPSSRTFQLQLVSDHISRDDIVLPQVDIHMLADHDDRWVFDYTVTLIFDDNSEFFFASTGNVPGIILDQDHRNHSGIGNENPLRTVPLPVPTRADTNAVLKQVTLEIATHGEGRKPDTILNAHIVNRLGPTSAQDILIALDIDHGLEYPDKSYIRIHWPAGGPLASGNIRLADMVLPVVYIVIVPNGDNQWTFDYQVTFEFESPQDSGQKPQIYQSRINGVILDQRNNKHMGVYQGRPFPTVAPPTAPKLTNQPVDHTGDQHRKEISIPFLRRKFDEFINSRNGPDTSHDPPLHKIHLSSSFFSSPKWLQADDLLPECYADVQSIIAGGDGQVHYVSSPISLGQFYQGILGDAYIGNLYSASMGLGVDASSPTPITLTVNFAPGILNIVPFGDVEVHRLSISLKLTLELATVDRQNSFGQRVAVTVADLMSWVPEIENMAVKTDHIVDFVPFLRYTGTFLHQPVDLVSSDSKGNLFVEQVIKVDLDLGGAFDPGETVRQTIRDKIFERLATPDAITSTTPRDGINSMVTSWLLGGVADDEENTDENNAMIQYIEVLPANPELGIVEDTLVISYAGPRNVFVPQPPADWPPADFSPGLLANIDHIVVLMMENRSFDHMLGYLSLPTSQRGMGRQDVDGLKGGEFNPYNGQNFPSLELTETTFSPDPPHGYEPVHRAINGGKMDGFVQSYAEAYGDPLARRIMGYHTGAHVPVYDALARDFAIGHRWFASHPGPTFCNRFYALTGRLNLDPRGFWEFDNSSPLRPVYTPTIFDYLTGDDPQTGQPITWRYFEHGYCLLRFFEKYTFDDEHIIAADDPERGFFAIARAGQLPSVSFIDPHFIEYPPDANCDGPPADISNGQAFAQRVVEAVIASPSWNKTLLLIVYDEHGGFYDHVPPPAAVPVSDDLPIKTHGVRVPAFVVSPWVGPGTVFGHGAILRPGVGKRPGLHFDHTSTLKTIARRFLWKNPPYMGARYAAANDLSAVISTQPRQPQFLPFIRYRLQYPGSGMMLEVQQANPAPGTILWQQPPSNDSDVAQDFSFEDAGDGFVYIRSHVSNLYITVKTPAPVVTGGQMEAAGGGFSAAADQQAAGLIQDVKYLPGHVVLPGGVPRPELQKWKLSPAGISIFDRDLYLISDQAHPDLFLQPADPSQSGSPTVLGVLSGAKGAHHAQQVWKVTSPLLDDQIVKT
jgi:phospholipase C